MGTEIERKFLPKNTSWRDEIYKSNSLCIQGYLSLDPERTVRVRTMGAAGTLTVKGLTVGMTRQEFEYEVSYEEAQRMLNLCFQPLIEKFRRIIPYDGFLKTGPNLGISAEWSIDVFLGRYEGLVLIEIEVPSEDTELVFPDWIGREVTDEPAYYNSNLAQELIDLESQKVGLYE